MAPVTRASGGSCWRATTMLLCHVPRWAKVPTRPFSDPPVLIVNSPALYAMAIPADTLECNFPSRHVTSGHQSADVPARPRARNREEVTSTETVISLARSQFPAR